MEIDEEMLEKGIKLLEEGNILEKEAEKIWNRDHSLLHKANKLT